ncbi:MAG: NAD-dependent epimerase/dehydratase family protein [Planctomycetota bacterium]|jgi:UDP-glucose 4-epimerase
MKLAVVTGGSGFIGTHLCQELSGRDFRVINIDPARPKGHAENVKDIVKRVQDIPSDELRLLVKDAHWIFHLAAEARVEPSTRVENLTVTMENNIIALSAMLRAAADLDGLQKFVFSSSSSVYRSVGTTMGEEHPKEPKTPYAMSKFFGEELCRFFQGRIPVGVARIFHAYGPYEPFFGFDTPRSTVVAKFINAKIAAKTAKVFGGNQEVDFTYISDVVSGLLALAGSRREGVFNLGTGRSVSVKHLAKLVGVEIDEIAPRPYDGRRICASVAKAARFLNWRASVSLEEGVEKSLAWWKALHTLMS